MRRPPYFAILVIIAGLVLAACASPSGGDGPGASAGGEPSTAPEQSQDGGGGGGGGGGEEAPVPAEGAWTGGEADVDVSGNISGSFGGPISPPSGTFSGATSLIYLSEAGTVTIALNAGDPFAVGITTADFVVGSSSFEDCEVDYRQADDSRIEATFRCDDADGVTMTGTAVGTVTIEGSFTATR